MQVMARSGLPSLAFKHWWSDQTERGVVIQKASFSIDTNGTCDHASQQAPLLMQDVFVGEAGKSSTIAESDLAPFKPRTDVIIRAVARPPGDTPLPEWTVGAAVQGRFTYTFQTTGPRFWQKRRGHWQLDPPSATSAVPIQYEFAYGGTAQGADDQTIVHEFNPLGRGLFSSAIFADERAVPAPQLGLVAEFMQADPRRSMQVCGFGPVGRAWLPRRSHAGTFDPAWRSTRHPRMPVDYSFAYWNSAPLPLQVEPYLLGNETIFLLGVLPSATPFRIRLPAVAGRYRITRLGLGPEAPAPMSLDTVVLDFQSLDPRQNALYLTWRAHFDRPGDVDAVETGLVRI